MRSRYKFSWSKLVAPCMHPVDEGQNCLHGNSVLYHRYSNDYNHSASTSLPSLATSQRKLPEEGWSDERIELLLQELALMDSNNYPGTLHSPQACQ